MEDENRRLKLLVAELSLHGEALKVNVRLLRRSCRFRLLYGFGTQFTQNKEVVFYLLERGQYRLAIVGGGGVITCSCRLRSGPA